MPQVWLKQSREGTQGRETTAKGRTTGNSQEEESERQSKGRPREAGTEPRAPQAPRRESFKNKLVARASAVRCYDESAPWSFCIWQYRFLKKIFIKTASVGVLGARMPTCR